MVIWRLKTVQGLHGKGLVLTNKRHNLHNTVHWNYKQNKNLLVKFMTCTATYSTMHCLRCVNDGASMFWGPAVFCTSVVIQVRENPLRLLVLSQAMKNTLPLFSETRWTDSVRGHLLTIVSFAVVISMYVCLNMSVCTVYSFAIKCIQIRSVTKFG